MGVSTRSKPRMHPCISFIPAPVVNLVRLSDAPPLRKGFTMLKRPFIRN